MSSTLNIALSVSYGSKFHLEVENLELNPGLYVILGANGSGKSTFLKALGRFIATDSYDCHFEGKNLKELSHLERCQIFSYAGARVESNVSVRDLLSIYQCTALDTQLSLPEQWMSKTLAELSDGEKQKVQHYLALQNEKKIVLLDEPTAHLDPVQKAAFWKKLQVHVQDFDKTVLVASHDFLELKNSQVQFLIIREGKLQGPFSSQDLPSEQEIYSA
jgi:ABC-type multidrug transport system ATPase subunit